MKNVIINYEFNDIFVFNLDTNFVNHLLVDAAANVYICISNCDSIQSRSRRKEEIKTSNDDKEDLFSRVNQYD